MKPIPGGIYRHARQAFNGKRNSETRRSRRASVLTSGDGARLSTLIPTATFIESFKSPNKRASSSICFSTLANRLKRERRQITRPRISEDCRRLAVDGAQRVK